MAETLNVTLRQSRGTKNARRQRLAGQVPMVLYGHGEESISLSAVTDDIDAVIRHGSRLVDLQGAVTESALLKDIQWDPLGSDVLHIDLTRVSEDELVEVVVVISLRGIAPGTKEGGVVDHVLHQVTISCPVVSLPDKFEVNINSLALSESIYLKDIKLPEGASIIGDVGAIVVQCVEPTAELDEEADTGTGAEPEVIGKKPEDEEQDGES